MGRGDSLDLEVAGHGLIPLTFRPQIMDFLDLEVSNHGFP